MDVFELQWCERLLSYLPSMDLARLPTLCDHDDFTKVNARHHHH